MPCVAACFVSARDSGAASEAGGSALGLMACQEVRVLDPLAPLSEAPRADFGGVLLHRRGGALMHSLIANGMVRRGILDIQGTEAAFCVHVDRSWTLDDPTMGTK